MRSRLVVLLALVIGITGIGGVMSASHAGPDKDCADFNSQAAAQDFFLDHGGPQSDPHLLDSDGDGVACESNPCPCNYGTGGGGDGDGGGGGGETPIVQKARIVKVLDGDTARVRLVKGNKVREVRLLGIDTPEFSPKQCGAGEAKRKGKKLMPRGSIVTLTSDTSQKAEDRYGRLLRYMKSRKSPDVSKAQLKRGMAKVYVVGKPFKRAPAYRSVQQRAKRQDKGLWATCF